MYEENSSYQESLQMVFGVREGKPVVVVLVLVQCSRGAGSKSSESQTVGCLCRTRWEGPRFVDR